MSIGTSDVDDSLTQKTSFLGAGQTRSEESCSKSLPSRKMTSMSGLAPSWRNVSALMSVRKNIAMSKANRQLHAIRRSTVAVRRWIKVGK